MLTGPFLAFSHPLCLLRREGGLSVKTSGPSCRIQSAGRHDVGLHQVQVLLRARVCVPPPNPLNTKSQDRTSNRRDMRLNVPCHFKFRRGSRYLIVVHKFW
jgi:hypothetical protein